MGWFGGLNISGEGQYILSPSGIYVTQTIAYLATPDTVQFRSTTTPKRLMHGGYIALGLSIEGGDAYKSQVSWYKYFEFEGESWPVPSVFCDTVYWHIPLGVQWYLDLWLA